MFVVVALVGGTMAFMNGTGVSETHSDEGPSYVGLSVSAMTYDDLVTMCIMMSPYSMRNATGPSRRKSR